MQQSVNEEWVDYSFALEILYWENTITVFHLQA